MVAYAMLVGSNAGFTYLAATLARMGISPSTTAAMLLGNSVAATVGGPIWSDLADRTASRAWWMPRIALASFVLSLAFLGATSPLAWGAALATFGVFRGGTGPLLDATTVNLLGAERDKYARIRAMGSLGFLVLALPTGWLQDHSERGSLMVIAVCLGIAAAALFGLPETGSAEGQRTKWLDLLRDPRLGPLSLVCLLHGWTLTTYDQFFSLLVEQRGLPGVLTGRAVVVGVTVEIAVMMAAPQLLRRFDLRTLLIVSVASGVPRWYLSGVITDGAGLVALQALHGLTFAAFWVAGVALFAQSAPPGRESSAQALFALTTYGIGRMVSMGLASIAFLMMPVDAWFRVLGGVSLVTTALAVWATRQSRQA